MLSLALLIALLGLPALIAANGYRASDLESSLGDDFGDDGDELVALSRDKRELGEDLDIAESQQVAAVANVDLLASAGETVPQKRKADWKGFFLF